MLLLLVAFACAFARCATAQTCQTPTQLTPDIDFYVDTCQSGYAPQLLCGGLPTTGPTVAFGLYLSYPSSSYTVSVNPASSAFDPVLVVQSSQCGESGNCPFTVDDHGAGEAEAFNFWSLDHGGEYYVLVTSTNPYAACGQALVILSGEAGDTTDGIFRSGFNY